jgi:hypothetical protein
MFQGYENAETKKKLLHYYAKYLGVHKKFPTEQHSVGFIYNNRIEMHSLELKSHCLDFFDIFIYSPICFESILYFE